MTLQHPLIGAGLFFVQAFLIGGITAVFDREKQLIAPDHVRSTILSAFSLSVQLLFIPLSFLFGFIANQSVALAFLYVGGAVLIGLSILALYHSKELRKARQAKA